MSIINPYPRRDKPDGCLQIVFFYIPAALIVGVVIELLILGVGALLK